MFYPVLVGTTAIVGSGAAAWMYRNDELLRRRFKVYSTAARVFGGYQLTKQKVKLMTRRLPEAQAEEESNKIWDETHEKYAQVALDAFLELEGFWVKIGQFLSSRADVMPQAYIQKLSKLQDALPPKPFAEIKQTVEEDLGAPIESLFRTFEETCLASASIAQVHRATLPSGEPVVVKVQHKGVDSKVRQDLKNLQVIMEWVAKMEPNFDFRPVTNEWLTEVPKELDFLNEANNMREVWSGLQALQQEMRGHTSMRGPAYHNAHMDPPSRFLTSAYMPHVYDRLVSKRVLTMEYIDGCKVSDMDRLNRNGVNKERLVEDIARAFAHQIHIGGLVNGDPHPGNILVDFPTSSHPFRPVLLDFGLTKRIPDKTRVAFARMVHAATTMDYSALMQSFEDMGLILNRKDPSEAMNAVKFFFRTTAPQEEEVRDMREYRQKQEDKMKDDPSMKRNPVDAFPSDLFFVFRAFALLRGLCTRLDVRHSYLDTLAPFAKKAVIESYPQHDRAATVIFPTPALSHTEERVRETIERLYKQDAFVGMQVAVYKDGKKIVDTAAGTMGVIDPRPVHQDSLFNCFSVTKGVTALAAHMAAEQGLLDYSSPVSRYWAEFSANGKEGCTVEHLLSHRAGLQNAIPSDLTYKMIQNWPEICEKVAQSAPAHPPGQQTAYHYLSFGWLVGRLIEKSTGREFRNVVMEDIAKPLGVENEFFVGVPDGVEDRLATLSNGFFGAHKGMQSSQMRRAFEASEEEPQGSLPKKGLRSKLADEFMKRQSTFIDPSVMSLVQQNAWLLDPCFFNDMGMRRACIPAANGHFSARALAKFYATLANGGHLIDSTGQLVSQERLKLACRPLGRQENTTFGLGFSILKIEDQHGFVRETAFGHGGLGGSYAFCDPETNTAIAITVNKLTMEQRATAEVIKTVCDDLKIGKVVNFHNRTTTMGE